jgi:ATP-dependent exoDNAse (exonuclease V) alpha subunit
MFYLFHLLFFLFGLGLAGYVVYEAKIRYISPKEQLPELKGKQKEFFDQIISSKKDFFVTGKAGTGKSMVLKHLRRYYQKKHINYVVTAPTGVASANVDGQTIDSFFGFSGGHVGEEKLRRTADRKAELFQHLNVLIIDEISMVRPDVIDAIDQMLRIGRKSTAPFGGVQVIMFGDLFQLPPVIKEKEFKAYLYDRWGGEFFFFAYVFKERIFTPLELDEVHRQNDMEFISLLNAIREGEITDEMIVRLNLRAGIPLPQDEVLTIAARNDTVDSINKERLEILRGKSRIYEAILKDVNDIENNQIERVLELKVGSQIIMIKNDPQKRWVNGTFGKVTRLSNEYIEVEIKKKRYIVEREKWPGKVEFVYDRKKGTIENKESGSVTQFPIKAAWAMTIHKAQGQTFERVIVDMGKGAFAEGQTYVAISRCKSFEGLYLTQKITRQDIMVNQVVYAVMKRTYQLNSNL